MITARHWILTVVIVLGVAVVPNAARGAEPDVVTPEYLIVLDDGKLANGDEKALDATIDALAAAYDAVVLERHTDAFRGFRARMSEESAEKMGGDPLVLSTLLLESVSVTAPQTPWFTGSPYSIPGTIQAENYDHGGEGVAYHDTTAANLFYTYRTTDNDNGMDVGQIAAGGFHIGALADAEWAEYTVNVPSAGNYSFTWRYSSGTTIPTTFRVLLGASSDALTLITPTPITVNSTGGWESYVESPPIVLNIPDNSNTRGSNRILRILFEKGSFNLDWVKFTAAGCTAPTISNPAGRTVQAGNTVTFGPLSVGGSPPPTIRWYRNNVPVYDTPGTDDRIRGATSPTLILRSVEEGRDGGNYTAKATTPGCTTATSAAALLRVTCDSDGPLELEENIARAVRGDGDLCYWLDRVQPSFGGHYGSGGSYNIPALSGAIAYIKLPNGDSTHTWNMENFWKRYLRIELGEENATDGTRWFFGGEELFSGDYEQLNITSVLAVYYQAVRMRGTGQSAEIEGLARRWLRATFALQAAAAMPAKFTTQWAQNLSYPVTTNYSGPMPVLAGSRTPWGFWSASARPYLLARALGKPVSGGQIPEARNAREAIEQKWSDMVNQMPVATRPQTNVYGLTPDEALKLGGLIGNPTASLPSNFVADYLGNKLRTDSVYHILAWAGARATVIERPPGTSTAPTLGVLSTGSNAYFLYPWKGLFDVNDTSSYRNVCGGSTAWLVPAPPASPVQMWSRNPGCAKAPFREDMITLPSGTRLYWITLGPDAPPSVH